MNAAGPHRPPVLRWGFLVTEPEPSVIAAPGGGGGGGAGGVAHSWQQDTRAQEDEEEEIKKEGRWSRAADGGTHLALETMQHSLSLSLSLSLPLH